MLSKPLMSLREDFGILPFFVTVGSRIGGVYTDQIWTVLGIEEAIKSLMKDLF